MSYTIHAPSMVLLEDPFEHTGQPLLIEQMVGVRSTFTYDHGLGRVVDVVLLDPDDRVVEVLVCHSQDLTSTTVTSVAPMIGKLIFS